jgi:purine-binding chemotaxis protein CheW
MRALREGRPMSTEHGELEYVTVTVGTQLFGLPISRVHDVFLPAGITPVPLARTEIAGILNLRGRVITVIDMRRRLDLPASDAPAERMAIGMEWRGESYGLLVDSVGDVVKLTRESREAVPVNLDPAWAAIAAGVHRIADRLMVVLDVDRVLESKHHALAA